MKFEAMTPAHGPLAVCGDILEHFVGITPEIVAYGYHSGVNECYTCTPPKGTEVQEEHEREKHPTFKFNKTVIGNRFWKKRSHCPFDKEQVIMFEITKCAKMEVQQNSDNFTVRQRCFTSSAPHTVLFQKQMSSIFCLKKFGKSSITQNNEVAL